MSKLKEVILVCCGKYIKNLNFRSILHLTHNSNNQPHADILDTKPYLIGMHAH
jgi:hypothetical protein